MKIAVICLAVTAVLSGCVSRTIERESVVQPRSAVVVPAPASAPSSTTVVVPQGATTAPSGDTTIIVPAR